jgi:hypothetical protein
LIVPSRPSHTSPEQQIQRDAVNVPLRTTGTLIVTADLLIVAESLDHRDVRRRYPEHQLRS